MCQNHYILEGEKIGRYGIGSAGIGGQPKNEDMLNGKMILNTQIEADLGAPGNDKKLRLENYSDFL